MNYKEAIETREYYANGFAKLSGCGVKAVNLRERKEDVLADVILYDYNDNTQERYNKCKYPKKALEAVMAGHRG